MIQITPQMRILVAIEAVDFRKGINGLARVCQDRLEGDPFAGGVFVFRNRSGTGVKILVYDGRWFWLCHKRLSSGRFRCWPTATAGSATTLEPHQVQVLLAGGDPLGAQGSPLWRRVDPPG